MKRPRNTGQLNYDKAAQEIIWLAIVWEIYTEAQVSKDNFLKFNKLLVGL